MQPKIHVRIGTRTRGISGSRVLCVGVFALVCGAVMLVTGFSCGVVGIKADWKAVMKQGPHNPAQMRGLLDSMIRLSADPPRVIPPSSYDDEVCAAAAVNMTNLVLGQERLKTVPAWFFAKANEQALELVYEREGDFEIRGDMVVEKKDRALWYSSKMRMIAGDAGKSVRDLYIVGYYYRDTRSARKIVQARANGGTLNSHLMLILGRSHGTWWGYHFFHDPKQPERSAFRVEALGEEMSKDFDLLYIWRVKNTEMPAHGASVQFGNRAPSYRSARAWVGWGWGGVMEYALDTSLTWLRFNRGLTWEVFPRVEALPGPGLVEVGPAKTRGQHGQILGWFNGVAVYGHEYDGDRTPFGQAYQCVEFVNRYYVERLKYRNMAGSGHASSYYWKAKAKGLNRFANGSLEPPRPDDILVFGQGEESGDYGHVGVVSQVDLERGRVCLVQQNMSRWHGCLRLAQRAGGWYVNPVSKDLPCLGWARKEGD